MSTDTNIVGVHGRVFSRDRFGVCTIQLDGYPSIIRVKSVQMGIAHHLKQRGCSAVNPTPVVVDLCRYDTTQMVFHGVIDIGSESFTPATAPSMHFTQATAPSMSEGAVFTSTRRMLPMVL